MTLRGSTTKIPKSFQNAGATSTKTDPNGNKHGHGPHHANCSHRRAGKDVARAAVVVAVGVVQLCSKQLTCS